MKYVSVVISPEEEAALSSCVIDEFMEGKPDGVLAYKWLCYVRQALKEAWDNLPAGAHIKDAYKDEVWSWSDEDLV